MSGGMTKNSKIMQYINYRMRVTVDDGRMLVGKFMAFDKHMNMVLCDCEEFRRLGVKGKANEEREEKRSLGKREKASYGIGKPSRDVHECTTRCRPPLI